jgi:hypothetical protein
MGAPIAVGVPASFLEEARVVGHRSIEHRTLQPLRKLDEIEDQLSVLDEMTEAIVGRGEEASLERFCLTLENDEFACVCDSAKEAYEKAFKKELKHRFVTGISLPSSFYPFMLGQAGKYGWPTFKKMYDCATNKRTRIMKSGNMYDGKRCFLSNPEGSTYDLRTENGKDCYLLSFEMKTYEEFKRQARTLATQGKTDDERIKMYKKKEPVKQAINFETIASMTTEMAEKMEKKMKPGEVQVTEKYSSADILGAIQEKFPEVKEKIEAITGEDANILEAFEIEGLELSPEGAIALIGKAVAAGSKFYAEHYLLPTVFSAHVENAHYAMMGYNSMWNAIKNALVPKSIPHLTGGEPDSRQSQNNVNVKMLKYWTSYSSVTSPKSDPSQEPFSVCGFGDSGSPWARHRDERKINHDLKYAFSRLTTLRPTGLETALALVMRFPEEINLLQKGMLVKFAGDSMLKDIPRLAEWDGATDNSLGGTTSKKFLRRMGEYTTLLEELNTKVSTLLCKYPGRDPPDCRTYADLTTPTGQQTRIKVLDTMVEVCGKLKKAENRGLSSGLGKFTDFVLGALPKLQKYRDENLHQLYSKYATQWCKWSENTCYDFCSDFDWGFSSDCCAIGKPSKEDLQENMVCLGDVKEWDCTQCTISIPAVKKQQAFKYISTKD